jgi:DNA-directed RNA polymerase specialized sigma24 family protein
VDVAYQLDCEWSLSARTEIARALRRWHEQQPLLRRFGSPGQLLRFLHSAPSEQTDGPLLALLALARHDLLARRTLLQVLLPALKAQAERMAYPCWLRDEVWEVLLYFAWETICRYPVERRRTCVATKLVLDVLHDASRELRRQPAGVDKSDQSRELRWLLPSEPIRAEETSVLEEDTREPVAPAEPLPPEAVVLEAVAAGALARQDAELILLTRVDAIRLRLLAQTIGVSYHALRQRRQRAEKRLREFLASSSDVSKRLVSTLVSYEGTVSLAERQPANAPTAIDVLAERAA